MEKVQGPVRSLPPISSSRFHIPSISSSTRPQAPQNLSFPHLSSAATKAERYFKLSEFDKKGIQRPNAHVRNALKTTDNLEQISMQLNQRLKRFKEDSKNKVSFDRLSICSDAFEEIIKTSGVFAPLLQGIKDKYNQYLVRAVSTQQDGELKGYPTSNNFPTSKPEMNGSSSDLLQLKKQLHHLEVESRVLLQENNRLRKQLDKERVLYTEHKQKELESLELVKNQPVSRPQTSSQQDYATQVENIQIQIAEEKLAIRKIISERRGRIPLSVCHNLEQCLREVEIETQKCQRHSEYLRQEIEKWKGGLWEQLQAQGYPDHFRTIWDTIITAAQ